MPPNNPIQEPESKALAAVTDGLKTIVTLLRVGGVLLLIGFCFSGVRSLPQYEKAVVLRFGDIQGDVREESGMVFALPFPVDELVRVEARRTRTLEHDTFWYQETDEDRVSGAVRVTLRPGIDGYLLTSDGSILHAKASLRYQVENVLAFAFDTADVEAVLSRALDNALLKAAGSLSIHQAVQDADALTRATTRLLSTRIADLRLGIEINGLDLQVSWPKQVADEMASVGRAREEARQLESEGQSFARGQLNEADSQSRKVLSDAETWSMGKVSRTNADAANFAKLYELYVDNPEVIKRTLYLDRLRTAIANVDEIYIVEEGDRRELRLMVPRETKKKKQ
ncbi:MAG: membrane protease subunit HflK [Rhodothermales bacterium]|jgi:membrane protease subunit HflK